MQRPHELGGVDRSGAEGTDGSQDVVPVGGDEGDVDAVPSNAVQRPIGGGGVDPPESGVTSVGQARAERVAEETGRRFPSRNGHEPDGPGHPIPAARAGFAQGKQEATP